MTIGRHRNMLREVNLDIYGNVRWYCIKRGREFEVADRAMVELATKRAGVSPSIVGRLKTCKSSVGA